MSTQILDKNVINLKVDDKTFETKKDVLKHVAHLSNEKDNMMTSIAHDMSKIKESIISMKTNIKNLGFEAEHLVAYARSRGNQDVTKKMENIMSLIESNQEILRSPVSEKVFNKRGLTEEMSNFVSFAEKVSEECKKPVFGLSMHSRNHNVSDEFKEVAFKIGEAITDIKSRYQDIQQKVSNIQSISSEALKIKASYDTLKDIMLSKEREQVQTKTVSSMSL